MLTLQTLWFCITSVVLVGPVMNPVVPQEDIRLPVTLEGDQRTELRARVEGYVLKVLVDIGDVVEKGQVLVTLEAPELEAEVLRKQQMLRQASAQLRVKQSAIDVAQAKMDQARSAMAEQAALRELRLKQRDRFSLLVSRGAVDRQKLDEANYSLMAVEASNKKIEADIAAAKADVAAAGSAVEFAQSGIEVAKADLQFAQVQDGLRSIRSPFSGIVSGRNVDPGTLVSPGNSSAMPLLIIEDISVLRGVMTVPAEEAPSVTVGDEVAMNGFDGAESLTGKFGGPTTVSRVSQVLDMNTRTMRVEIDVANPRDAETGKYQLLSGQYGSATISTK